MKTPPTQYGTVLVFKTGTTKEQAEAALLKLKDLIDEGYQYPKGMPPVQPFNPTYGGPVWYVP